jgi:hypothetical protein
MLGTEGFNQNKRRCVVMLRIRFVFGALMLAAALGVVSPRANAQDYKGKFSLPYETYWGGTVLQPGEYTVWTEDARPGATVLRVSGNGKIATALIGPVELRNFTGQSRIVLVEAGGIYALKEFDAGVLGKSFSFALPKGRANMPAAVTQITVH